MDSQVDPVDLERKEALDYQETKDVTDAKEASVKFTPGMQPKENTENPVSMVDPEWMVLTETPVSLDTEVIWDTMVFLVR